MTKDDAPDAMATAGMDRSVPLPDRPDGSGDGPTERPGARPARWDVATLCGDTGEAILIHKGEHYRLRVTARGRLILTK